MKVQISSLKKKNKFGMKGSRIWTHNSEDTSTQYHTNH